MKLDCQDILKWTEAQLKYDHDVSLQEATPQALHQALRGQSYTWQPGQPSQFLYHVFLVVISVQYPDLWSGTQALVPPPPWWKE